MAIIDSLGLDVSVQIDGVTTPEYNDPDPCDESLSYPAYTAVCNRYIESRENVQYTIVCKATKTNLWLREGQNHGLQFTIYVDGNRLNSVGLQLSRSEEVVRGIHQTFNGHTTLRKFIFSAINTVDDADAKTTKKDAELAKNWGMIRIAVRRHLITGRSIVQGDRLRHSGDTSLSVAEKALKGRAVSHGTSFSPAVRVGRGAKTSCRTLDSHERPYAMFYLKYRSRDALQSEMIIPRSPSPALSLQGLDREQVEQLARERLAEMKEEKNPAIKREFTEVIDLDEDDNTAPRRPWKIQRRGEHEVIDLTDD